MTVFARSFSHICRICCSTSGRDCPLSANVIRNNLPARTSSTPENPSELSECWIAFPWGSSTECLSSTTTVIFNYLTLAVNTSSIRPRVVQPGAGSVLRRLSVQIGWATPPYATMPS